MACVQSEVALWSELVTQLTDTRSIPEALEAYSKCVSQWMQMTAEDGQRLLTTVGRLRKKSLDERMAIWKHVKAIKAYPLSIDK